MASKGAGAPSGLSLTKNCTLPVGMAPAPVTMASNAMSWPKTISGADGVTARFAGASASTATAAEVGEAANAGDEVCVDVRAVRARAPHRERAGPVDVRGVDRDAAHVPTDVDERVVDAAAVEVRAADRQPHALGPEQARAVHGDTARLGSPVMKLWLTALPSSFARPIPAVALAPELSVASTATPHARATPGMNCASTFVPSEVRDAAPSARRPSRHMRCEPTATPPRPKGEANDCASEPSKLGAPESASPG